MQYLNKSFSIPVGGSKLTDRQYAKRVGKILPPSVPRKKSKRCAIGHLDTRFDFPKRRTL